MLTEPFRGTAAIARGLVTPGQLRGPRFRRLFPDIHVLATAEVDLALRSRAAALFVAGCGVLGGYSAAELLGASCGPADAPAEVVLLDGHRQRPLRGLLVRRDRLVAADITHVRGVPVTTPRHTAYDLARRLPLTEAVVAVDALAFAHGFDPADLLAIARAHLGARGTGQLAEVVGLANPLAESPMETRIRLALLFGGLPLPVVQYPVGPYRLDMAYPALGIGIEYDGREHLTPERAMRDLDRQAYLTAAGWRKIFRFRAGTVLGHPTAISAEVRTYLAAEARRRGVSPAALVITAA
ncbi:DUF559 domain-containing protein [Pseudonocardia saturnea]